jgi:hypothetical protein
MPGSLQANPPETSGVCRGFMLTSSREMLRPEVIRWHASMYTGCRHHLTPSVLDVVRLSNERSVFRQQVKQFPLRCNAHTSWRTLLRSPHGTRELAGNSGGRMQLAICCHEKTWRQWDIHGKTQTRAKTTKRWNTAKDETAVIQEGK